MARRFKEIKRDTDYRLLHHRIVRLTARVTERKISKYETGNSALLDDILCSADYYCGNAVCFEVPGDQTHGLVADRSERNQKRNIDLVGATKVEHRRRILLNGPALAKIRWHAVEAR